MSNVISTLFYIALIVLLTTGIGLHSFAQDKHTVLLYTFETGNGNTVKDLSGYGNDGTLMGPKWDAG